MDSGVHLVLEIHRKSFIYISKSEHPKNKKQNILLDLAKIRVSYSYKGQLVLKFLHNTKHDMYYLPAKNQL